MADNPTDERRKLHVRVSPALLDELERLRYEKSKKLGRRVSLRELVEDLLVDITTKKAGKSR